jgi:opacity protein-like surface antigen
MRKLSFGAVLTALAFGSAASASTVSLRWTGASDAGVAGLGTSVVDVSGAVGPVLLTLDLVIGIDSAGLSAYGTDLEFDTDGANELDLVSFQELSWANAKATRTLGNITPGIVKTQESGSGGPEGQVFGFEAFTLGTGANNLTLTFARVVFRTSAGRAQSDGDDIFSSNERDPFATAFINNAGAQLQIAPFGAAVNGAVIPEPGTFALLGLGLGSLAVASRRRA